MNSENLESGTEIPETGSKDDSSRDSKGRRLQDLSTSKVASKKHDTRSCPSKSDPNTPTKSRNRKKNQNRQGRNHGHKKLNIPSGEGNNDKEVEDFSQTSANNDISESDKQSNDAMIVDQQALQLQSCNDIINENNNELRVLRKNHEELQKERSKLLKEQIEYKNQLKLKDSKISSLFEQTKSYENKIKELDTLLASTSKTCNQLEKLIQQEVTSRNRLMTENENLNQVIGRLKAQIVAHEKNKFNSDELVRVLNATLMERETEISILKLKMTRIQTNSSSTLGLNSTMSPLRTDPCQTYATTGRSNSEFSRNSPIRSTMLSDAATLSTSRLKDASVWAKVPEELTPSKRPPVLERSFKPIYSDLQYHTYGGSTCYSSNQRVISQSSLGQQSTTLKETSSLDMKSQIKSNNVATENIYSLPKENETVDSVSRQTCQITNLDDSINTSQSSGNKNVNSPTTSKNDSITGVEPQESIQDPKGNTSIPDPAIQDGTPAKIALCLDAPKKIVGNSILNQNISFSANNNDSNQRNTSKYNSTPIKFSESIKKMFGKFRRSDSSTNSRSKTDLSVPPSTPIYDPFRRSANRSTMIGTEANSQLTPKRQINIQTDKPFAQWETEMIVDWLTMIGLSMYTVNCRRWVKCGAHIMNATPAEVDKGLGITNHLHRKKLRLAISELNGDCDKVTKAASKLDFLWVARWLEDIGLPQYKEAFINARIDGRVLNYLTVEDLVSLGIKSVLHHASIRCGIKVLRSVNFDLQSLKRRATAEEAEQMNYMRQQLDQDSGDLKSKRIANNESSITEADLPLWTCHRVMEWLRMIDFAEFAPNLRGSGVHGGLIMLDDRFNLDTMCSLLSIANNRTLLRRHLTTFFERLVGSELAQRKNQMKENSSIQQLNPTAEIKTPKKSQLWLSKLKSPKVGQDGMDDYLCPIYPLEPHIINTTTRKPGNFESLDESQSSKIPESINV